MEDIIGNYIIKYIRFIVELKGIFALFVLRSALSAFDLDHEQTNIRYMYRNEASKHNIAQLTMIFVK